DRRLTILTTPRGAGKDDFTVAYDERLTMEWASLVQATLHKLLLEIPGGLLMVDMTNPARPEARAFFRFWQGNVLFDGGEILVPAGRWGVHQLPVGGANLFRGDGSVDPTVLVTKRYAGKKK
ncbi:MAG: hypothetical protein HYV09_14690, partial [Deltaproteobacteria bacterium]|nr:hypothetical protein [Deltaproteobacteria bacterium]